MPKRIQLSRAKGWRLPPDTVKVDRTTRWGNQFKIAKSKEEHLTTPFMSCHTAAEAVNKYKLMLASGGVAVSVDPVVCITIADIREALRGKNLACWCKPGEPCHADVLLELANPKEGANV